MDNNLFIKILENVSVGKINLYNYHNSDMFYKFYDLLWKDILLLPHYTPDGRFEKILFEQLKDAVHNGYTYDGFFKNIERELNQLVVPCLILIPLNFMNNEQFLNIDCSEVMLLKGVIKIKILHVNFNFFLVLINNLFYHNSSGEYKKSP